MVTAEDVSKLRQQYTNKQIKKGKVTADMVSQLRQQYTQPVANQPVVNQSPQQPAATQPVMTQAPARQVTSHATQARQGQQQLAQKQQAINTAVNKPMTNYVNSGGRLTDTASIEQFAREQGVPEKEIEYQMGLQEAKKIPTTTNTPKLMATQPTDVNIHNVARANKSSNAINEMQIANAKKYNPVEKYKRNFGEEEANEEIKSLDFTNSKNGDKYLEYKEGLKEAEEKDDTRNKAKYEKLLNDYKDLYKANSDGTKDTTNIPAVRKSLESLVKDVQDLEIDYSNAKTDAEKLKIAQQYMRIKELYDNKYKLYADAMAYDEIMNNNIWEDTAKSWDKGVRAGMAKTINGGWAVINRITGLNAADINAAGLLKWNNGERDDIYAASDAGDTDVTGATTSANDAWHKFERIHNAFPDSIKLNNLYNQISTGTYKGTSQDLMKELDEVAKDVYQTFKDAHTQDELDAQAEQLRHNEIYGGMKWLPNVANTIGEQAPSYAIGYVAGGLGEIGSAIANGGKITKGLSIIPNVGSMRTPGTIANTLYQVGSYGTMGLSAGSGAMDKAIAEGAKYNRAFDYGVAVGATEVGTERLGGETVNSWFGQYGKTALGKVFGRAIDELNIESKIGRFIANQVSGVASEVTEEMISEALEPLWETITYNPDALPDNLDEIGQYFKNILNAGVEAIPSTLIMQGAGMATQAINVQTIENGLIKSINENTELSEVAKKQLINEVKKASNEVKAGVSQSEAETIDQQIYETMALNSIDSNSAMAERDLANNNYDLSAAARSKDERNIANKLARVNATIDKDSRDTLQLVQDNRPGLDINFDTTIEGNGVIITRPDGTRQVLLNPKSNRAAEFTLTHELVHDIEGTQEHAELKKMILEDVKLKADYEEARTSLEKTYNKLREKGYRVDENYIDNEAVADVLASSLGDQTLYERMYIQSPTLANTIKNWFDDTFKQKNLTSNQKKLKNKFEKLFTSGMEQPFSRQNRRNGMQYSKKLNGYYPDLSANTNDISKFKIKDINNLKEVKKQISDYYKNEYLSDENISKPITNIDTGLKIEIWKSGINETFGNEDYYKNLSEEEKKAKLATMDNLAKMIKYGEVRAAQASNYHNQNSPAVYYYLEHPLTIDGQPYMVNIDIRKVPNTNGRFHIHSIQTNKVATPGNSKSRPLTVTTSINSSIPPSNQNVNNVQYSLSEANNDTQSRMKKLNDNLDLTWQTRDSLYDKREELEKQYNEIINSEDYKNAFEQVKAFDNAEDAMNSDAYKKLVEAQRIKNSIRDLQEEIDIATADMRRMQEEINNLENEGRTPEKAIKQAKKIFGTTTNFNEAGYILQDGKMLDFSGRKQGNTTSGRRALDHRQINEVGYDMDEFIGLGNIRLQPEGNGFQLMIEPTEQQYKMLEKYINQTNGEVFIDIYKDGKMAASDSAEYKKNTPTSKIIDDLRQYFKTGKFPTKSQYADFLYSKQNSEWQQFLENYNFATGKKSNFEMLPSNEELQQARTESVAEDAKTLTLEEGTGKGKKVKAEKLEDIINLTEEDVKTTPGQYIQLKDKNSSHLRKFFENVETSNIISDEVKDRITMTTYEVKNNQETLEKMAEKLDAQGNKAITEWWSKDTSKMTDDDIALGAVLLERYQQQGDIESAVNVVHKLGDTATKKARALQMYSIFQRLTPEAMIYLQQKNLDQAFENLKQKKTGKWVEQNRDKFNLNEADAEFIQQQVEKAAQATDEETKQRELSKIEARINSKLPPEAGQTIKALRRMAMLFNPKTQVRNIAGNTLIIPVNDVADFVGTALDKAISLITGVRTTSLPNVATKAKGFAEGIRNAIKDYKTGTRTTESGSRFEFEVGAKPFNENTNSKAINKINAKLNRANELLSAVMSGGDRPFYEAAYRNSLEGQMKANKVTEPTQEMIDIATNEALSRTWNDNNRYTQAVLQIRNAMNILNVHGFGLGDLIIPFAKTPANLTKAMVEYSPVGFVESLIDFNDMRKAISRGEMTPQQQKRFVTSTSKAIAGTLLYAIAGSLIKAGKLTGSADDDKDVKNFEQNVLGIQPYSIKLGDKTYTYSWANPINAPLAIMADTYKMTKENASKWEILDNAFKTAGDVLTENSFLSGIKELFGNDGVSKGVVNAIENAPVSLIPTFISQIASAFDKTKRQTFEYKNQKDSIINSIKNKIPGARNTLAPQVNTFGEEIENDTNPFNIFLNPANVREAKITDSQKALYDVYQETKDKTIFPMQAPYNTNTDTGEKKNLTSKDRTTYQKASGQYVNEAYDGLFDDETFKNLRNEGKVKILHEIATDGNLKGRESVGAAKTVSNSDLSKLNYANEKLEEAEIPLADYYIAWYAKNNLAQGKTNDARRKAIRDYTDLTANQEEVLYEIFNIEKGSK